MGGLTRIIQETRELPGFAAVAECSQRIEREARIAYPAVAIIPISFTTDLFRQRGRWRSDDRAAWRIGKEFEHQPAAQNDIAIRSLIPAVGRPFFPKRARNREQLVCELGDHNLA